MQNTSEEPIGECDSDLDTMRSHYDFSGGVRGATAARYVLDDSKFDSADSASADLVPGQDAHSDRSSKSRFDQGRISGS